MSCLERFEGDEIVVITSCGEISKPHSFGPCVEDVPLEILGFQYGPWPFTKGQKGIKDTKKADFASEIFVRRGHE